MNAWIDGLNSISATWLEILVRASWQGGIALALVWLIARFASRLPAAHKVWLWRLAFLKLLAGLIWLSPVVLPILPQRTPAVPAPENIPMTVVAPAEAMADLPLPAMPVEPTPSSLQLSGWLFLAWCAALIVCALRVLRHWLATRRLLRGSRPLMNATVEESVRALCERLRRRRPPSISESPAVGSPILVGIFRPQIILPRGLADSASPSRLELMLAMNSPTSGAETCSGSGFSRWAKPSFSFTHWFGSPVGSGPWRPKRPATKWRFVSRAKHPATTAKCLSTSLRPLRATPRRSSRLEFLKMQTR
jgi:hypothetical protein